MVTKHPRRLLLVRASLTAVLFCTAAGVSAGTASEFYLNLLRRGASHVEAGRYQQAIEPLRVAAFGLVESVADYETAHINLAIANDKLGNQDEARAAAMRVVAAERIEPRYQTLPIPQATRSTFDAIAEKVLTAVDLTTLRRASAASPSSTATAAPARKAPATGSTAKPETSAIQPPPAATEPASADPSKAPPSTMVSTTTASPPRSSAAATSPPATTRPVTAAPPTQSVKTSTPPASSATPPSKKPAAAATSTSTPPPSALHPQVTTPPQLSAAETDSRLQAADRALTAGQLVEARKTYRELLDRAPASHALFLKIGEGLYRARDFSGALAALNRAGALKAGEEAYRYYVAVALYETGDFAAAKRELQIVLPYIEVTPDVSSYRTKIESHH